MVKNFILIFSLAVMAFFVSCDKNTTSGVDCTGIAPTYTADVAPILINCSFDGCHGNTNTQAGVNLTSYANVKNASSDSKFLKSIKHESGAAVMPPNGFPKMSDDKIKLIECWIQNGKPE